MGHWAATESAARAGSRHNALRMLAGERMYLGDIDVGRSLALQGLEKARRLKLRGAEARLLNVVSIAAESQGDLAAARDPDRLGLRAFRDTGDRINKGISLLNLGEGCRKLGDLAQARREPDAALRLVRS